jgi:hypothetical protein
MSIRMSRIVIALGVAMIILIGVLGIGVPESQAANQETIFTLVAGFHPDQSPICVGDELDLIVRVQMAVTRPEGTYVSHIFIPNATVNAGVSLGELSPARARIQAVIQSEDGGVDSDAAKFTYRATEAGRGRIELETVVPGEFTGGQAALIGTTVRFEVEECPPEVSMVYQGSFEGEGFAVNLFGVMDEVMLNANDDGTYSGSGTSVLTYIVYLDSPTCSMFLEQDVSQVDMTATVTEQVITLVFDPQPGVWHRLVSCPRFGEIGVFSLLDIGLTPVTLPGSGGVVRLPPVLFPGYFTIIVTRETGEGAVSDAGVRLPSKLTGLDQAALSE